MKHLLHKAYSFTIYTKRSTYSMKHLFVHYKYQTKHLFNKAPIHSLFILAEEPVHSLSLSNEAVIIVVAHDGVALVQDEVALLEF